MSELPQRLERAFSELSVWSAEHGALASQPFARYAEVTPEHCTLEAGFVVDRPLHSRNGVVRTKDAGGYLAMSLVYQGPYSAICEAYKALQNEIARRGYELAGAPVEYYLTPPEIPTLEHKTEIVWPVVLRGA